MDQKMKVPSLRRMGAGGVAARTAGPPLTRAEVVTTIRRFGFILLKAHEIIMSRLEEEESPLAEHVNDVVKPIAEMLVSFDLEQP